jgi:hypothetical protein
MSARRVSLLVGVVALLAVAGVAGAVAAGTVALPADEPAPERWNETYGPSAGDFRGVTATDEGGALAVGSVVAATGTATDGLVVRVDRDGTSRLTRTYGGPDDDVLRDVVPTADGGALLVGATASRGAGGTDGWVLRVGPGGAVRWRLVLGDSGDDGFTGVARTADGYLVAGTRTLTGRGDTDGWLVAVTPEGTVRWTETYNRATDDAFADVARGPGGQYVLAGRTAVLAERSPDAWLVAVDENGTEQWRRRYGGRARDQFRAVRVTERGVRAVGATRSNTPGTAGWLVAVDGNGTGQWRETYEAASLFALAPAAGGDASRNDSADGAASAGPLLLAGETARDGALPDGLVVRVGPNGTAQWRRAVGGPNLDSFAAVAPSTDGGHVFAGTSGSYATEGATSWLRKLGGATAPVTPTRTATPLPAGGTPAVSPTAPTATAAGPGATPPTDAAGTVSTTNASAPGTGGTDPLLALLAVLVGFVVISGGAIAVLRYQNEREDPLLPDRDLPGEDAVPDLGDLLGRGSGSGTAPPGEDAAGTTATDAAGEVAGSADGPAAADAAAEDASTDAEAGDAVGDDLAPASTDPPATPGDADGGDAVGGGGAGELLDTPGEAGPGTFTITNVGETPVTCRFRCQTRDRVEFDHWVDLDPGITRRAHAIPATDAFQIAITVEDGPLDSRIFRNDGSAGTDVTVRVSEADIDISRADG